MIDDRVWNAATPERRLDLLKDELTSVVPTISVAAKNSFDRDQRLFETLREALALLRTVAEELRAAARKDQGT